MTSAVKDTYRTPKRYAEAEVSLSEFSSEELHAELAHRRNHGGDCFTGAGDPELDLPLELIARLRTLILCGQRESALREISGHLEPFIGKLAP